MKALLICPAERPASAWLNDQVPLVLLPALGFAFLKHWMEYISHQGFKSVRILATDRPELVRECIQDGKRWGLQAEVIPTHYELSPDAAWERFGLNGRDKWVDRKDAIMVADHFPGNDSPVLFDDISGWFAGLQCWMKSPLRPARLGSREVKPGIWVGLGTQISASAKLIAPCWVGQSAWIGPETTVGPDVVLEDCVVVEAASLLTQSHIGPETFVGMYTEINNSFAWGDFLLDWKTKSGVRVPDRFILSSLTARAASHRSGSWMGRLTALLCMFLTSPFALYASFKAWIRNHPLLTTRVAVCPQKSQCRGRPATLVYYEFELEKGWGKRWPQLWSVVCGQFTWVGNRPISPSQAEELTNDFERLWLASPVGLISLADAEACSDPFGDEAKVHASFYAVQSNWKLNASILFRTLANGIQNT